MNSNARSGRRAGTPATREAILAAAREAFIQHGYRGATIRRIAADAGVDPALVLHFFHNKEGLFREAMRPPLDPAALFGAVFAAEPANAGATIARLVIAALDSDAPRRTLLGLVRSAVSEESAAQMIREGVLRAVEEALEQAGIDQPGLRAALIGSQLIGLAMARYVVRAPAVAGAAPEELVAAVGPTLQRYISGNLEAGNE